MQAELDFDKPAATPFEPAKAARTYDPETSHRAAARAGSVAAHHHALILQHLRTVPDATYHEIGEAIGVAAHAVGKRMSELERARRIEQTGTTRTSPSGREARVWRIRQ